MTQQTLNNNWCMWCHNPEFCKYKDIKTCEEKIINTKLRFGVCESCREKARSKMSSNERKTVKAVDLM